MRQAANTDTAKDAGGKAAACWSCRGPVAAGALFCAACGAVQPPGALDHFARLGLPRRFALDRAELDRRYFDLQRKLHPDRFAGKPARERAISQLQAAAVNEAYETLGDALARAVYLLRLGGIEIEATDGRTVSDPALLAEAMEMREELAGAADARAVRAVAARAEGERKKAADRLAAAFDAGDLNAARGLALRLKYLTKLDDDARARIAALRDSA